MATFVVYLAAVQTQAGQAFEDATLDGGARGTGSLAELLSLALLELTPLVALVLLAGVVLLGRRRGRFVVLLGLALVVLSVGIVQVLQETLTRPVLLDSGYRRADQSFPSGHTALALSTYAATLLAVPARHRRLAVCLAGPWALGVCLAVVTSGWHRPSDVLGAALIVLGVAAAAYGCAARAAVRAARPVFAVVARAMLAACLLPVAAATASLLLATAGPSAFSLGRAAILAGGSWTLLGLWWLARRADAGDRSGGADAATG
ncbi:phosphatase PAP2 family protein [Catellatospora citrea]|uniref:phosphatase PAP2 family protein n=1 Tax=Catellatospora citrea TaxID=53366 RepID=UPI0014772C09|nr:phosphatase PAP2 family protein [Catellatospora citrea]